VLKLTLDGIVLTEIAPGVDLAADIQAQSEFPLIVSPDLKVMDAALFAEAPIRLSLSAKPQRTLEGA
jgi:propionate CoA-transferase